MSSASGGLFYRLVWLVCFCSLLADDSAVCKRKNAVGSAEHKIAFAVGDQDGCSRPVHQQTFNVIGKRAVEVGCRFVSEKDIGLAQKGSGDADRCASGMLYARRAAAYRLMGKRNRLYAWNRVPENPAQSQPWSKDGCNSILVRSCRKAGPSSVRFPVFPRPRPQC